MKDIKKWIILINILSITLLSGCWNYREISNFAIVSGLAIDKDPSSGMYNLNAEIIEFPQTGKDTSISSKTIEADGENIFDASRNMIDSCSNLLYWGHSQIYIVSEDLAREGIIDVLDWISRDAEIRVESNILISKEDTANAILLKPETVTKPIAFNLQKTLELQRNLSKAYNIEIYKFINILSTDGISATLPVVSLAVESNKTSYNISGTAIFKVDKLVGFLDGEETKFFLFVIDEIKGGLLLAEYTSDAPTAKVALEIFNSNTKIKPNNVNGKLVMNINIRTEVSIGELGTSINFIEKNNLAKLKSDAETLLENDIKALIKKVQENYDADIFGFGRAVKNEYPEFWKEESENWSEIFKDLPVDVKAELEIKNTALNSKPIIIGD